MSKSYRATGTFTHHRSDADRVALGSSIGEVLAELLEREFGEEGVGSDDEWHATLEQVYNDAKNGGEDDIHCITDTNLSVMYSSEEDIVVGPGECNDKHSNMWIEVEEISHTRDDRHKQLSKLPKAELIDMILKFEELS